MSSASGTGRGRGKGRGAPRPTGSIQQPDTAAMDRLNQEKESITQRSDSSSTTSADPPPSSAPSDEQPDSAMTTIGEGKQPQIVEDLKEAVRSGIQVGQPPIINSVFLPVKLDPGALPFVPQQDHSVPAHMSSSSTHRVFTKHSALDLPSNRYSNSSTHLNPESKEFVPNPSPPSSSNGPSCENGFIGEEELDEGGYIEANDIVRGFERAAPTEKDDNSDPVLRAGAEMLLRVYNYPGSFDENGKKFKETVKNLVPSENTLINLAEMLISWGLQVVDLRYAVCRVCLLISQTESTKRFKIFLMARLQEWHKKVYREKFTNDEERYSFVNFSGFMAEMYSKIMDAKGAPIVILGTNIFVYVEKLLNLRIDYAIREACNILKLTGNLLIQEKVYDDKMPKISKKMRELAMDQTLSKTCTSLIMQVSELVGSRWSCAASPLIPPSVDSAGGKQFTEVVSTLNTNAAPFVPAEFIPSETFYDPQVIQQPVTSAEDWDEFVGEDQEDQVVEEIPEYIGAYDLRNGIENDDYDDYDGLDPEIELEMEAFIDEIEEHLLLQDFDPDLQQQPKAS